MNTSQKNKLTNTKYLKLGELFCGPGGLALGAVTADVVKKGITYKIKHEWANDYDLDSCKTYTRNFCPNNPDSVLCCDVRSLDINKLSAIDIFAYGFPCNDFSVVGERKGFNGKYGPLYTFGVRMINKFKPKFFIAENVSGIISANEGKAFKKILEDLSSAGSGYNLTVHLYKAEEYGIPQTRHRIFIVGIDKKFNHPFLVPAPTHVNKYKTAGESLKNIPNDSPNNEFPKTSKTVEERLKYIKPGENAWTADLPDNLRLNVKFAKMSQIYKRLDPNKPSYTITGSGGGGTYGYHWSENRALTNRERARIQSFPDNFVFEGSYQSVRKQIGMAVPPKLSNIIFTSALKTILGIDYDYIENNIPFISEPLNLGFI